VAPRGVVSIAALGVLIQDAWALHSVGAWLSVAGVGAVVWAGRAVARAPRGVRLAAPALAATLVTAPISAFAFGTVAPIGVLANLIAIPLAGVAVPGLVIALMLSWLASGPAHLIAAGAGLGLALLDLVARRDAGRRVVVPFLRGQGVGRVAVVVATHGDADHLGGLPAVVEAFDPELVLEPGELLGRPLYLEFLAGVEASGARWHAARAGDRIEVDG